MKNEKDTQLLSIAFALIVITVALVMLALFTLSGKAQADDGYPAPIDYGYPIGYPIYDPYPVEYGYPVDVGYPVFEPVPDPIGYPAVEVVSEPTFSDEWQAEMQEVREVIENVQPIETTPIYKIWQQLKVIVRHYYGQMIMRMR